MTYGVSIFNAVMSGTTEMRAEIEAKYFIVSREKSFEQSV